MVSYDSVLRDLYVDKVYRGFFGEPSSTPREVGVAEQQHILAAASSSVGVLNVDSLLLDAL